MACITQATISNWKHFYYAVLISKETGVYEVLHSIFAVSSCVQALATSNELHQGAIILRDITQEGKNQSPYSEKGPHYHTTTLPLTAMC